MEDVNSTSHAHFRGVVGSVTSLTLAFGAWVVGIILWDVPQFLIVILVPGNRTPGSFLKRSLRKALSAKYLFQLRISERYPAIGADEYSARFEVTADRVDTFDLL